MLNSLEQYMCQVGLPSEPSVYIGKLEVVKQEMARANIDILGIIELKWNGWI